MIRHPDYRLSEIPAKYNLDLALMAWERREPGSAGFGSGSAAGREPYFCCMPHPLFSGRQRRDTAAILWAESYLLECFAGCLVLQGMASISPRLTGGVIFAIMFIVVYAGRAYDAYTCVWNGGNGRCGR